MLEVNEDPYKSEIIKPRFYCPCQRVSRCACPTYHMCGNPNMGKWRNSNFLATTDHHGPPIYGGFQSHGATPSSHPFIIFIVGFSRNKSSDFQGHLYD